MSDILADQINEIEAKTKHDLFENLGDRIQTSKDLIDEIDARYPTSPPTAEDEEHRNRLVILINADTDRRDTIVAKALRDFLNSDDVKKVIAALDEANTGVKENIRRADQINTFLEKANEVAVYVDKAIGIALELL